MAASSLSKGDRSQSPTAIKSASQLPLLDLPATDDNGVQQHHQYSLPNRSDPKTRSTPFDEMLSCDAAEDGHN